LLLVIKEYIIFSYLVLTHEDIAIDIWGKNHL